MKVSESEMKLNGRCDFCQIMEAKHTINGGLWWICQHCMAIHYGISNSPDELAMRGEEE